MIRTALALPALALLAACGGGGGGDSAPLPLDDGANPFEPLPDEEQPVATADRDDIGDCAFAIRDALDEQGGFPSGPNAIATLDAPGYSSHTYRYPGRTITFAWGPQVDGCAVTDLRV